MNEVITICIAIITLVVVLHNKELLKTFAKDTGKKISLFSDWFTNIAFAVIVVLVIIGLFVK